MKILPNGVAVIERDTHFTKWIEECGRLDHDWRTLELFKDFIPIGGAVVDAGAYIGDQTRWYLDRVGPVGTVIAFEPNREAYQCLIHNCAGAATFQNGLGLGSSCKSIDLNFENIGASYIREIDRGEVKNRVFCIELDCMELTRLNFLKMDIEGMEDDALKGCHKTIKMLKPAILLEINKFRLLENKSSACLIEDYLFHVHNYKLSWRSDGDVQWDALYIPK